MFKENKKKKVFISYSHKDKNEAYKLLNLLKSNELYTFIDDKNIALSADWKKSIFEEFLDINLIIFIISKNFNNSLYCLQEAGIGCFLRKYFGIPFIVYDIDCEKPVGFLNDYQSKTFDLDNDDDKNLLIKAIKISKYSESLLQKNNQKLIEGLINAIELYG